MAGKAYLTFPNFSFEASVPSDCNLALLKSWPKKIGVYLATYAVAEQVLAWPKATSLLVPRLVYKDRHKDSLRSLRMPWQGHLACQQPHRLEGLAGSIGSTAGSAFKSQCPCRCKHARLEKYTH